MQIIKEIRISREVMQKSFLDSSPGMSVYGSVGNAAAQTLPLSALHTVVLKATVAHDQIRHLFWLTKSTMRCLLRAAKSLGN